MSLALGAYRVAMAALEPFAPMVLNARARKGKEDPARIGERLGRASKPRPDGKLVWLHGVSVGESLSLLPLIERIQKERPDLALLITSGTTTSAELLAKRLPASVVHQYAPIDTPGAVRRFLDHWRPDVGLFAESELWPNLILGARERGMRLALVSARITEQSARGWARRPGAARALLGAFALVLPQDDASARRLADLGAPPGPLFNLKLAGAALPFDAAEMKRLKAAIGARPVVLGASTHPGEEAMIAAATPAEAFLVLAVRHPERGAELAAALGPGAARRSAGAPITSTTPAYIADTLGEMGLWFRLADVIVMGGAFSPGIGGHNPLEPAKVSKGVISGPHAFNFQGVYEDLIEDGGARITPAGGLGQVIAVLLSDGEARARLNTSALAYAQAQSAAFETGWTQIKALLP